MKPVAEYAGGPPKRTSGQAAGTYALWLGGDLPGSTAGMFVSDARLDVSFTAAQARLATSCWITNGCACAGIGLSPGGANGETPDA
jgi:hypothetical protein